MATNKFTYVGRSPNGGKEFDKGISKMIIYSNGFIRYWPDFDHRPIQNRIVMERQEKRFVNYDHT